MVHHHVVHYHIGNVTRCGYIRYHVANVVTRNGFSICTYDTNGGFVMTTKSTITAITVNGVKYVPLAKRCEQLHVDYKRARRFARKNDGTIAGARKMFGKRGVWVIPHDADIVLPDAKRFGAEPRADGRQRYIVFATKTEHTALATVVPADCVVNPRTVAKQRREQRKRDAAANDAKQ